MSERTQRLLIAVLLIGAAALGASGVFAPEPAPREEMIRRALFEGDVYPMSSQDIDDAISATSPQP